MPVTSDLSEAAQGQEDISVKACLREDSGQACLPEAQALKDNKESCFEEMQAQEVKGEKACVEEEFGREDNGGTLGAAAEGQKGTGQAMMMQDESSGRQKTKAGTQLKAVAVARQRDMF